LIFLNIHITIISPESKYDSDEYVLFCKPFLKNVNAKIIKKLINERKDIENNYFNNNLTVHSH